MTRTKYDLQTPVGISGLLEDTATHLETHGWCRGEMVIEWGGRSLNCLVGGLRCTLHGSLQSLGGTNDPGSVLYGSPVYSLLAEEAHMPSDWEADITAWNDGQRDKRKVTRLLRRVARKVRAGQYADLIER